MRKSKCHIIDIPTFKTVFCQSRDNQIYDNKNNEYAKTWDYKSSTTQRIKIIIKVPEAETDSSEKGCVTLVSGIKNLEGGGF